MKVLFIQDNLINESPALCDLSAVLKDAGYSCNLLIEKEEKDLFSSILEYSPDIFVIPCDVGANLWCENLAKKLKKTFKQKIIFCGTYPSFNPEIIENPNIDIVCIGEVEYAILELLNNLKENKEIKNIRNLWIKENGKIYKNDVRPLIEDLDLLPFPDRELYFKKYKTLTYFPLKKFTTGRGCPNNCSFCFNRNFKEIYQDKGTYVRRKSPQRVVEEIKRVVKKYLTKSIHFSDDLFTDNKLWVLEFCNIYKNNFKIPFTCNTTVDTVDEEMIKAMKDANCSGIAIGVETGNEKTRLSILNKPYTTQQIIDVAKLIKKHNIYLTTFNMIGLPGEDITSAFETIKFNCKIKADNPRVNLSFAIPKTKLTEDAIKDGFLDKNFAYQVNLAISKPIFKTKYKREFENLYYLFEIAVKFEFLEKLIKLLIKLPLTKLYKILIILRLWREKKFFKIPITSAIKFYLKVGNPLKRTKNFNNFIP